jgi:hypothetical protein
MTLVRRVALGISSRVVRWASPGCREWAEGLEREVEFIEGDWRALAWAVGSTRVLLERRGARATAEGGGRPRALNIYDLGIVVWCFYCAWFYVGALLKAKSPWDRTAVYLLGFAWGYRGVTSIAGRWRERWQPPISSDAYLLFRRKELERKLARSRTAWQSLRVLAITSFVTACVMGIVDEMRVHPYSTSAVLIALVALTRGGKVSKTTLQEQIARMDEQIAEAQIERAERIARGGGDKPAHSNHWGRSEAAEPDAAAQIVQLRLK